MARTLTLSVHCEILSTDEGQWCDRCLLPSAVRTVLSMSVAGRLDLLTRLYCRDCESLRETP